MTAFFEPDAALAKVARDVAMAQENADRAGRVKLEIDLVRGRGRSKRGEVVVEVDATGVLVDLVLADAALDLRADVLARTIREVIAVAQRDAAKRSMVIADDAFGAGSPVTAHLRGEFEQRLGGEL